MRGPQAVKGRGLMDAISHGGRVLLELERQDADGVAYRVTLQRPDATWSCLARVALDGAVTVDDAPADAPGWLVDAARAFLRTLWSARRGPDAPAWPRRVLRWRPGPAVIPP
jgi:hypothetical protein